MGTSRAVPGERLSATGLGTAEVTGTVLATASRRWVVVGSLLVGVAVAVLWSFEFVDQTIGGTVADTLLGYDAAGSVIAGSGAAALFAFVSGMAGTFTACNIAAFAAVAPMVGQERSAGRRMLVLLRPLGWLAVGMLAVSATYGAVGVLLGDRLPQLSTATTTAGMPVRLVQSTVVFGIIGAVLTWLGLAAVGVVADPLAGLRRRFRPVDAVVLGALIGAFLVGRPFGLFFKLFRYAADHGDPLYGAGVFALQSVGNVVVLAAVFVVLVVAGRGRLVRWLGQQPQRAARLTGAGLLVAGAFTFVYWVVRVPALFGYGWFPTMPWQ
ncbi:MAG TPA: hypothetical protein VHF25_13380 [Nitriliruptorales bacterium]|nr:hypothetical protein [Nitriliruptorales bacterium]